jgi:hypothetical protein
MKQLLDLVFRVVYGSTNGRPTGVSLSSPYVTLTVFEGTLLIRSTTINLSELSTLCKQSKKINFTKLHVSSALLVAGGGGGGRDITLKGKCCKY